MYNKISLIKKLRELPNITAEAKIADKGVCIGFTAFGVTNIRATIGLKAAKDFVEEVEAAAIENYKASLPKPEPIEIKPNEFKRYDLPKPVEFKMGDKVHYSTCTAPETFVVLNRHDVSGYVEIDEVPIVRLLTGDILFVPKHLLTKVY